MDTRRSRRHLLIAAAIVFAATGCSDDEDVIPGAGLDPTVSAVAPDAAPALLSTVSLVEDQGFDQLVVEFESGSGLPGWDARYIDAPPADTEIAGSSFLEIEIEGATLTDADRTTYDGEERLGGPGSGVVEAVLVSGSADSVTWIIGTSGENDFRVSTADSPPRIVIDIRHG